MVGDVRESDSQVDDQPRRALDWKFIAQRDLRVHNPTPYHMFIQGIRKDELNLNRENHRSWNTYFGAILNRVAFEWVLHWVFVEVWEWQGNNVDAWSVWKVYPFRKEE